jgi:hypothetical protein
MTFPKFNKPLLDAILSISDSDRAQPPLSDPVLDWIQEFALNQGSNWIERFLSHSDWHFSKDDKHGIMMYLLSIGSCDVIGYFATTGKTVYDVVIKWFDKEIIMISFRKNQMDGTDVWWQIDHLENYDFISNPLVREFFRNMAKDFVRDQGIVCEPITR